MDLALINKIIVILIDILSIYLGSWIFLADRKSLINRLFLFWMLILVSLVTLSYLTNISSNYKLAISLARWAYGIGVLNIIPVYFISLYLIKEENRYRILNILILITTFFLSGVTIFSSRMVKSVKFTEIGTLPLLGGFRLIFFGILVFWFLFILSRLFAGYSKLSLAKEKLKVQYFLVGLITYLIANLVFNVFFPIYQGIPRYYYIGNYSSILIAIFTAYAIVKRQLFDIKVVLTDLLVGIMGIILLVFPFFLSTTFLRVLGGIVFILFCFFGYYLIKAVREEEKRRQQAEMLAQEEAKMREEAERFKKVSVNLKESISQVLDLEEVIPGITDTLVEALKIDKISFALKQPTSEFYQFQKSIGFLEKELTSIIKDTTLCSYLEQVKKPLAKKELEGKEGINVIYDKMEINEVELLLPLFQKQRLIGIIFIGKKLSAVPYSDEEIELLENLSYQISISINNSLLYEEIKKDKEALERFYHLTVGREVRMTELKKKIKDLEEKLKEKE